METIDESTMNRSELGSVTLNETPNQVHKFAKVQNVFVGFISCAAINELDLFIIQRYEIGRFVMIFIYHLDCIRKSVL